MHQENTQLQFLKKIENSIPAHQSLANQLCDILAISTDSAYRRLRGETSLSIDEVSKLCEVYNLSFDSFINSSSGQVTFNHNRLDRNVESFETYFDSLIRDLKMIGSMDNSLITYACQDIPIFHNIHIPYIGAFKIFYWLKSILGVETMAGQKFDIKSIPSSLIEKGQEINNLYKGIKCSEIWTDTTVRSSLKQIKFYWESGVFSSADDAILVCEGMKELVYGIQQQAELGSKMVNNPNFSEYKDNYNLYISEIEINNNTALVDMQETKAVYLGHLTFNTMSTTNDAYCQETQVWFDNIVSRSTLVSKVGEKHRYQFFSRIIKSIDELIEKIKEGH